jgi:hypothetical protein
MRPSLAIVVSISFQHPACAGPPAATRGREQEPGNYSKVPLHCKIDARPDFATCGSKARVPLELGRGTGEFVDDLRDDRDARQLEAVIGLPAELVGVDVGSSSTVFAGRLADCPAGPDIFRRRPDELAQKSK